MYRLLAVLLVVWGCQDLPAPQPPTEKTYPTPEAAVAAFANVPESEVIWYETPKENETVAKPTYETYRAKIRGIRYLAKCTRDTPRQCLGGLQ